MGQFSSQAVDYYSWITSETPTWTPGFASDYFRFGEQWYVVGVRRGFLKWGFNDIPSLATCDDATLSLWVYSQEGSNNRTFRVYRVKRKWTQGSGPTWNKYDSVNDWQTAGGFGSDDCEQTDIGSVTINADYIGRVDISLDPTAVQEMFNGEFVNNGFMIKADTEVDDGHSARPGNYATEGERPLLVINYTGPISNVTPARRNGWGYTQPPNVPYILNRESKQAIRLIHWYPLDTIKGLKDVVGTMDAIPDGAPTIDATDMGRALKATQGSSAAYTDDMILPSTTRFTISAWAKASGLQTYEQNLVIFGMYQRTGISWNTTDSTIWYVAGIPHYYDTSGMVWGRWYNFVMTYNGAKMYCYIDGILRVSYDETGVATNDVPLNIAGNYGYERLIRSLSGNIRDVRIYDRILSASEVAELHSPDTRYELYQPVLPSRLFNYIGGGPEPIVISLDIA